MRGLPTLFRRLSLPLAAAGLVLSGALHALPCAGADEPEVAPPLERLSPQERAALERRIPGLGGLPREKQEQIARNIERLRGLDPEQRQLVERRFKAAREAGLGGQDLAERGRSWRRMPDGQQTLAEWQGKVMKALGWRAWRELPVTLREHPAMAPLLFREWPGVFHQRYLAKAAAALDAETAKAWQPPATLPATWSERFAKERAKLLEVLNGPALPNGPGLPNSPGQGRERALQQLKRLVLQGRALEAVREAFSTPVTGPDSGAARLALLGERLGALTGPAFADTVAELSAEAQRLGPEAFAAQVRRAAEPEKLPPELQKKLDAYHVVLALESWRSWIAAHPALVPQADALLRAALVDDLGMAVATFEALPARDAAGEARAKALRQWADETLPRELRKHAFAPRGLPERGPLERRPLEAGPPERPGGWKRR